MKGDKVNVRAFGNERLVRRVWEVTPDVVLICSEENYMALENGEDGLWPVGILRGDVFNFVPDYKGKQWESLTQYE